MLAEFIKKLHIFNVLYGAKNRKLTGIRDRNNKFEDTVAFTAPNTITSTLAIPDFFQPGTLFRVTNGGGANEGILLEVASVSGNIITTTPSTTVFTEAASLLTLDARLATVHNDQSISKLNSEGDTIFNVNYNGSGTGQDDCSNIGLTLAEHYHDDPKDYAEKIALVYDSEVGVIVGDIVTVDEVTEVVSKVTTNVYPGLAIGVVIEKPSSTKALVLSVGLLTDSDVPSVIGLTPGKPVFISNVGTITSSAPITGHQQKMGFALKSNAIYLSPSWEKVIKS